MFNVSFFLVLYPSLISLYARGPPLRHPLAEEIVGFLYKTMFENFEFLSYDGILLYNISYYCTGFFAEYE